jgi:uncharacterized membrane protein (UPF0182 family)
MLFAWYFNDPNILISSYITADSRIMFRRTIQERVATIAPFLRLDRNPYLVVSAGRLLWVQDAYTISSYFPYAQSVPSADLNYIRNSIKVVIDAYNGSVDLYLVDPSDAVAATYQRIFPACSSPGDHAAGAAATCPLPGGAVPHPGASVPGVPHGHPEGVL